MSEPVIRALNLRKSYPSGPSRLEVLRGLDLDVGAGETVAVVGESGAGKSTLLHLLGGLDRPDSGSIHLGGRDLTGQSAEQLTGLRNREVGYVFQFHHLLPEFSAEENIMLPLLIRRESMPAARLAARTLLEELGIGDRADRRPAQLSGGEQQRVAIARALVGHPAVLLADEPTGNLDFQTSEMVFGRLREAVGRRRSATVLVTHSERLARRCDRMLVMEEGSLRELAGSRYRFGLESPAGRL